MLPSWAQGHAIHLRVGEFAAQLGLGIPLRADSVGHAFAHFAIEWELGKQAGLVFQAAALKNTEHHLRHWDFFHHVEKLEAIGERQLEGLDTMFVGVWKNRQQLFPETLVTGRVERGHKNGIRHDLLGNRLPDPEAFDTGVGEVDFMHRPRATVAFMEIERVGG